MSLVSIIIPVYNGAEYLHRGVYSIASQSYGEIEIVFVNDGSTDDSEAVISNLMKGKNLNGIKYQYMVQKNAGIASARNAGLEKATGEYIMFMDQDDWLEHDCVETLLYQMEKTQSDLVIGGFKLVEHDGKIIEKWVLDDDVEWSKFRITAPWGRMFRKSIIDKWNIRFMNTFISEDLYFNILFFSYTPKIKVIPYIGYNWLHNSCSESRMKWNVISKERNPLDMLEKLHKNMHVPNEINKGLLTFFFVKYIMWYLLYSAPKSSGEMLATMYCQCIEWLDQNYPDWEDGMGTKWKNPGKENVRTYLTVVICVGLYKMRLLLFFLQLYRRL